MIKNFQLILRIKIPMFIVCVFFGTIYVSGQSFYYVKRGNQITKVENSDPTKLNVKQWQVLLFKNGASKTAGTQWGIIDGKSASEVMSKLKSSQDFELRFNKWAGKGAVQDEVFTNFNALGPVAVVENKSSGQSTNDKITSALQEKVNKVKNVYDQVKDYYNGYQKIVEIIKDPKPETPFDNVGNVFREYSDNLKQAFQRVSSLQNQLQKGINLSMDQIDNNINEINNNLSIVKSNAGIITQKLNITGDRTLSGNNTAKGDSPAKTNDNFDKLSDQLTNAFTNMDANDPDAAYAEIRRISRLLAKSIQDDPDSDEDMRKLGELLFKMSDTDDTDQLMEYLQKMTELMNNINK